MTLDEFHSQISTCTQCSLCQSRTQVVPGVGNPHAKILFVGEAPGKNEDIQGEPFVGAAGKLLNTMLESIGLERKDIFIANTVKCRPPNNRDPLPEEIASCLPYLKQQILLIKPIVIVTLGRFALHLFFPDAKMSEVHGNILEKGSVRVLALYHPAAALYNGGLKDTLMKDFQILKNIV